MLPRKQISHEMTVSVFTDISDHMKPPNKLQQLSRNPFLCGAAVHVKTSSRRIEVFSLFSELISEASQC